LRPGVDKGYFTDVGVVRTTEHLDYPSRGFLLAPNDPLCPNHTSLGVDRPIENIHGHDVSRVRIRILEPYPNVDEGPGVVVMESL